MKPKRASCHWILQRENGVHGFYKDRGATKYICLFFLKPCNLRVEDWFKIPNRLSGNYQITRSLRILVIVNASNLFFHTINLIAMLYV